MAQRERAENGGDLPLDEVTLAVFMANYGEGFRKSDAERIWGDLPPEQQEYWQRLGRAAGEALVKAGYKAP